MKHLSFADDVIVSLETTEEADKMLTELHSGSKKMDLKCV